MFFLVSTLPNTPLPTNVLLLRSMPWAFQIGFRLHQQPFRISILVWLLPLLSMWRLPLSQNQSYHAGQWVLYLLGSTNLQSIFSNVRRFPADLWKKLSVKSVMEVVVLKLLQLLRFSMKSWNPTDNQILPKSVFLTFLLKELRVFAPRNIGVANQMMICFATKS